MIDNSNHSNSKIRILIISPYHGGSHQAWAEGYQKFSQHDVQILSLPARFWKWRMHGGSVTLAHKFLTSIGFGDAGKKLDSISQKLPDVILATDMVDLTTFLALTRPQSTAIPIILYMHENQLTYPLPADGDSGPMRRQKGERDLHYAFINFASMLAADEVLFNSRYQLESFFEELNRFLRRFPDYNELNSIPQLREKSSILPVGIDFQRFDAVKSGKTSGKIPLILWNQRWEYDKNPSRFFQALYRIAGEGYPFRLALCGQNFRQQPTEFDEATSRLADRIIFQGYASEEQYRRLLWEASITLSTAEHEFFGISIAEAIYCHTFPILPNRLSYPELIPPIHHQDCLYNTQDGLLRRIRRGLTQPADISEISEVLANYIGQFDWRLLAHHYDEIFSHAIILRSKN